MVRRRDHSVSTFERSLVMSTSNVSQQHQDLPLLQGADKHLKKDWVLFVAGKKYVASDIVTLLQSRVDAAQETTLAKAAWHKVRTHEETLLHTSARTVAAFRQNMLAMFADSPDALADFGLAQRKAPRALTPAELVEKAAKAKATRAARHTMGSRQKKATQGSVVASDVVAPSVVSAPPTPPAPAVVNGSPTPAAGGS
jgi:hypothetical protein